jgi:hypothetical protein
VSAIAFFGAVELGLVYAFVALGVFLAFRVLDFPDLTVDGSFPLGAGTAAVAMTAGINPWVATLMGAGAAACAGLVTATLNQRFKILHLLASILTMIALFSVPPCDGPAEYRHPDADDGADTVLRPRPQGLSGAADLPRRCSWRSRSRCSHGS